MPSSADRRDLIVVYDRATGEVKQTLVEANAPRLASNEAVVTIPLHYMRMFSSFDECCRTIPQLVAFFDPK